MDVIKVEETSVWEEVQEEEEDVTASAAAAAVWVDSEAAGFAEGAGGRREGEDEACNDDPVAVTDAAGCDEDGRKAAPEAVRPIVIRFAKRDARQEDKGTRLQKGKKVACPKCSKVMHGGNLKRHLLTHTGERPFPCGECGSSFALKAILQRHMLTHTGERPFRCGECGSSFARKASLQTHLLTHTAERPFRCGECGSSFALKAILQRHLLTHTGERPFGCDECGSSFARKAILQRHLLTHTGERPFRCGECGSSFALKAILQRHLLTHTGKRPFCCGKCGSSFARKSSLQRHMLTHTGKRPFRCDECGSSFALEARLQRHMVVHAGERPFACRLCGAKFAQSKSRSEHYKKAHEVITGHHGDGVTNDDKECHGQKSKKKVPCPTCHKAVTNLNRHMLVHTDRKPFSCLTCGKTFRVREQLQKHTASDHGDERPFSCLRCDKSYKSKDCLKRHMMSHAGGQRFSCHLCGAKFGRGDSRRRHYETIHGWMAAPRLVEEAGGRNAIET